MLWDSLPPAGSKYGGPPIHSRVHEMQSQNFDKKAHEQSSWDTPCCIFLGIYPLVSPRRGLRWAGDRILWMCSESSAPLIPFKNPLHQFPSRIPRPASCQCWILYSVSSLVHRAFRAEFFTVCSESPALLFPLQNPLHMILLENRAILWKIAKLLPSSLARSRKKMTKIDKKYEITILKWKKDGKKNCCFWPFHQNPSESIRIHQNPSAFSIIK